MQFRGNGESPLGIRELKPVNGLTATERSLVAGLEPDRNLSPRAVQVDAVQTPRNPRRCIERRLEKAKILIRRDAG